MSGLSLRHAASALCLHCGLCCNGVLFKDVELRTRRELAVVAESDLPFRQSKTRTDSLARIPQPCAALCDDLKCRVYKARPDRCRAFECALFQEVTAGKRSPETALRIIRRARRLVSKVESLLESIGDTRANRPLRARFQSVQRRLETNGCGDDEAQAFAELSETMHTLNLLLGERFHP